MSRVLIIDDEEIIRRTIFRMGQWEKHGMQVIGEAENGLDGLSMICSLKPDVVFLDMRMPGLLGTQVIEALLEREIHVKLVVVSGFDSYEYMKMTIRYGAVDYLLKPIQREEMEALLERLEHVLAMEGANSAIVDESDTLAAIHCRIEQNCCQPLSLESLAQEFFLNKEYLSRAFKKRYGTGITAMIHTCRIAMARTLLEKGLKIRDVAERTGYEDVSYFGRCFRKYAGMSPSEYQEQHQHN